MKRFILICLAVSETIASTLVADGVVPPASEVFFFQGVPDERLDLCIDGSELATAVEFRSMVHAITLPSSATKHRYTIREPSGGACDGSILDAGRFYAYGGDQVIVMTHLGREGASSRATPLWLPRHPPVRRGETRFVVGHFAVAPRVRLAIDGERVDYLTLKNGGSIYIFRNYVAGTHTFTLRTDDTRKRLARQTIWMPQGVEFLLVLYGSPAAGIRLQVFSRDVGVR
jgi:hypothetical protein